MLTWKLQAFTGGTTIFNSVSCLHSYLSDRLEQLCILKYTLALYVLMPMTSFALFIEIEQKVKYCKVFVENVLKKLSSQL